MRNVYPYGTSLIGALLLVACEQGFGNDDDIIYGQPCELTSEPERFAPDEPLPGVVGYSGTGPSFFELTKDIPNSVEVGVHGFGALAERGPRVGQVSFESVVHGEVMVADYVPRRRLLEGESCPDAPSIYTDIRLSFSMDNEFDEVYQGRGVLLVKGAGSHIPEDALRLWVQIPRSEVSPMAPDYSAPNLTWTGLRIESRFAPSHVGGVITYEEENEEAVAATPMFYWDENL